MLEIEVIETEEDQETGKAFMHRSAGHNIFPTPYSMTEQFLDLEQFDQAGSFLEPACGMGHMVRVLEDRFKNVTSYDISAGKNFYDEKKKFDYVVTNPPFGEEADKFVEKSREIARHKFALLLRTNYLSGQARYDSGIYKELRRIYVFTRMPEMRSLIKKRDKKGKFLSIPNPIREDGKYPSSGIVYAWMVWEKGYTGKPEIEWINNQKYILSKRNDE